MEKGALQIQELMGAGFSSEEISEYKDDTTQQLFEAGFAKEEINKYWGIVEPNEAPLKNEIQSNFKKNAEKNKDNKDPKKAEGIAEIMDAGWQMSVAGLLSRQKSPEITIPEDASMATNILASTVNFVGDIPAIVLGGLGGGLVGGPMGSGAGGFALPTAIRELLMDYYSNGSMNSFQDLWERGSGILLDTVKSATVGAATAGVGTVVGKVASPLLTPASLSAAKIATEAATMTTVGAALDGEIPKAKHFIEASVFIGGMHSLGLIPKNINSKNIETISNRLRKLYGREGITPDETLTRVTNDRVALEDLTSDNGPISRIDFEMEQESKLKAEEKSIERDLEKEEIISKERPTSVQKILDRIEYEPGPETILKKGKDKIIDFIKNPKANLDRFYISTIDNFYALNRLVKSLNPDIEASKDPYISARLTKGSRAKAEYFLMNSSFSNKSHKDLGVSLAQITNGLENKKEFDVYLLSKHALEVQTETGLDIDAAKENVELLKDKYDEKAIQFSQFREHLLTVLKDAEIISKNDFENMTTKYKSYVPLKRVLNIEGEVQNHLAISSDDLRVKSPIKERKGSTKKIKSPILETIKDAYTFFELADKNKATTDLINLLKENNDFDLFKIVEEKKSSLNENEIAVFENGKKTIYEVRPDLAEAVKGMETEDLGFYTKVASRFASIKRAGIIYNPVFTAMNFLKDLVAAPILSKSGFVFLKDTIGGMSSVLKKDEYWEKWVKSGGAYATISDIENSYIKDNIWDLDKKTGIISKGKNVLKNTKDMVEFLNHLIEKGPRVSEFKRALEKGIDTSEAAFRSRDVTIDYARHGAQLKSLRAIIAFWNAHLQGVDKSVRAITENPVEFSRKAFFGVMMPSFYMYMINKDDSRYQDLTNQEKDLYWWFFTKDYNMKIPKPFELGVIYGALPERMMGAFEKDNPEAFKKFSQTLKDTFIPKYIPTALEPFLEILTGRSQFTGNRIVPVGLEHLFSDLQYTPYTTEVAKNVSKMLTQVIGNRALQVTSPVMIDHLVNAWAGNVGTFIVSMLDESLIKSGVEKLDIERPTQYWSEIPFIRSFVKRFPSMRSQSIENFYEDYDKSQRLFSSLRALVNRGDPEAQIKELQLEENQLNMVRFKGIHTSISKMRDSSIRIYLNKEMNANDKRQLLDALTTQMILSAQQGNKIMLEVRKVINAKPK